MAQFTTEEIDDLLEELEEGKIKPDHLIDDQFGKITLLHAILMSEHSHLSKLSRLKAFINLGCDVDTYSGHSTPISMAAGGVASGPDNIPLVKLMLKHHKKGHRSDLNILEAASGSLDLGMFEEVLKTGMVDTNVTQMKGSHILHHLADNEDFAPLIDLVFKYAPDTNPNPIHRRGYSPLTHAINFDGQLNAIALKKNGGKMIGKIGDPFTVVDLEMTGDYDGNFFDDYPDAVEYTVNNNKEHLLPKEVVDMFLF